MRVLLLPTVLLVLAGPAFAAHTNNIMLTGYWPPTNEMLREWSTDPVQNPSGWNGGNWEGLGYDVYSFFPEFNSYPPNQGYGDFEVDYQDTSADFWQTVAELQPIAIITFGLADPGDWDWELEGGHMMYAPGQWSYDYAAPYQPDASLPIYNEAPGTVRNSSLPLQQIVDDVMNSGAPVDPYYTAMDDSNFLCNFIGYHANWYHELHASPDDPAWNIAAGHIHVGGRVGAGGGWYATTVTLRSLITYLDTVVPEPGTLVLLLTALALRRR